jgi:hypothetical protein
VTTLWHPSLLDRTRAGRAVPGRLGDDEGGGNLPPPSSPDAVSGYCDLFDVRLSMTASRLKLPGFCRGG